MFTLEVGTTATLGINQLELRRNRLVLTREADSQESVPLGEVDGRRWLPWFYPHYAGLHFRRRAEVVLADLIERRKSGFGISVAILVCE